MIELQSLLAWSLAGMLTGAMATVFLTSRSYGQTGDIGIGVLGALGAGLLVGLLGLQGQVSLVASTAAAFAGAILLTSLGRQLHRTAPVSGRPPG